MKNYQIWHMSLTKYMLFFIVWWPVDILERQCVVWTMLKPSSEFIFAKTGLLTIMFFFQDIVRTRWLLPAMPAEKHLGSWGGAHLLKLVC
jgi:hypothetical protein